MTQEGLAQASRGAGCSVSIQSVQAIEAGRRESVMPRTARGLELALQWPEGTIQAILDGKEPPDIGVGAEPAPEPPRDDDWIAAQVRRFVREELGRPEPAAADFHTFLDGLSADQRRQLADLLMSIAETLDQTA